LIYLDNAATTPVRRDVLEAMWPFLTGDYGNPSSHHQPGRVAADALAEARRRVAAVLGCRAGEIIFTGGGTEADNLAVKGIALANPRGRHIVISAIEHEAVRACCDYLARHHAFSLSVVGVDQYGRISPDAFLGALRPDTTLCSIMLANNEVGTIQPVAEFARLAHLHGVPFHTDAVQAAGALDLNVQTLGVDALSLSGHKLGAPKGIGLLYVRSGIWLEPVMHGGGQERGRRSGTENVAGAVGLAVALELAEKERAESKARLTDLRDLLIAQTLGLVTRARLTGDPANRLPASASFCFPGTGGETMLQELEEQGIVCSSGSACAAGSDEPSPVLLALGYSPDVARTAVRFTLGRLTTESDVILTAQAILAAHAAILARAGNSSAPAPHTLTANALPLL
jgi:cysteine desulfurase